MRQNAELCGLKAVIKYIAYAEFIEKANTTEERRLIAAKYIMSESERLQKISEILLDGAFIRENEIEMVYSRQKCCSVFVGRGSDIANTKNNWITGIM